MIDINREAPYGTVELKIRKIVEQISGVNYLFVNNDLANYDFDRIVGPTIVYFMPLEGTFDFRWNCVKDSPRTSIAFVVHHEFDFDGEGHDQNTERMKRLCFLFVKLLNDSGYFEPIEGDVDYNVFTNDYDDNMVGVSIEPELKEIEGVLLCDIIERDLDKELADEFENSQEQETETEENG